MIFITIVTLGLLLIMMLMIIIIIIIIITIIILVIHIMSPLTALYNQNGTFCLFFTVLKTCSAYHSLTHCTPCSYNVTTSAIRKSYSERFTDPKELKLHYFSVAMVLSLISELETWLEFHHQFCWAKNSTIYLRKYERSCVIKISDSDTL